MVYKKFIKRGGKKFGPYYYESYRDSRGNVKTRYVHSSSIFGGRAVSPTNVYRVISLIVVILLVSILSFANIGWQETLEKTANIGRSIFGFANALYSAMTGYSGESDISKAEIIEGKPTKEELGGEPTAPTAPEQPPAEAPVEAPTVPPAPEQCIPDCTGKECGDNGCGGSCGTCSGNKTCSNGQCVIGIVSCTENWVCTSWSICNNQTSKQTRTCSDANKC